MTTIHIQRDHTLSRDKLHKHVDALAEELQSELAAQYHWEGDTLHFSRKGASGTIKLEPKQLEVQIKLGVLLRPLKAKVEKTINKYLDEHLG